MEGKRVVVNGNSLWEAFALNSTSRCAIFGLFQLRCCRRRLPHGDPLECTSKTMMVPVVGLEYHRLWVVTSECCHRSYYFCQKLHQSFQRRYHRSRNHRLPLAQRGMYAMLNHQWLRSTLHHPNRRMVALHCNN